MPQAIFYSYAYPSPEGFADAEVLPAEAEWNTDLGEFVLPYEAVRRSENPRRALRDFLETTYLAAARAGDWDVEGLAQSFRP